MAERTPNRRQPRQPDIHERRRRKVTGKTYHVIQAPIQLNLNTGGAGWTFFTIFTDGQHLYPILGEDGGINTIIFEPTTPTLAQPSSVNPRFLISGSETVLTTTSDMFFEAESDFKIRVNDAQGRRWRVFDQYASFDSIYTSPSIASFTSDQVYSQIKYREETLGTGEDVYIVDTWNYYRPANPVEFDVWPDYTLPSDLDNYSLGFNFYKISTDELHENEWQENYANGDPYWVNTTTWAMQWENVENTALNDGDELYPEIDLFWTLTSEVEVALTPKEIRRRSLLLATGYRSFKDWINEGGTYSDGAGITQDEGYFEIDLQNLWLPLGQASGVNFSGTGYLHLTMATADGSLFGPVSSYKVQYEDVATEGDLSIINVAPGPTSVILQTNGFVRSEPESELVYTYTVDSGEDEKLYGFSPDLVIDKLVGNTTYVVGVSASYMNMDLNDTTGIAQVEFTTFPYISGVGVSTSPHIDLTYSDTDGIFLYDTTFSVDTADNDQTGLEYAFFREDSPRPDSDYLSLPLNSTTTPSEYFSGIAGDYFQANASFEFTDLLETELEGHNWIVIARNSTSDWRYVFRTAVSPETIVSLGSDSPDSSEGIPIQIPVESSNRYAKGATINSIDLGTVSYENSRIENKSYKTDSPLRSLALEVEDEIPAVFDGEAEEFIRYYLVIGSQKLPITPKNHTGSFPQVYHLNTTIPDDIKRYRRDLSEEFIQTADTVSDFGIEVELNGDVSQKHLTPIVYSWKVIAVTESVAGSLGAGL